MIRSIAILMVLLIGGADFVRAGAVLVGSGARIDSGTGDFALGCHDLEVAGLYQGGAAGVNDVDIANGGTLSPDTLSLSGDWSNAGTTVVPGTVQWNDDCGSDEAQISGNSDFSNLEMTTTQGRTMRFDTGGVQFVESSLNLVGSKSASLVLRSSVAGQSAELALAAGGSQTIAHVDVADIDADLGQKLAPGLPETYASVDSGGNRNWFQGVMQAIPVPTLNRPGILMLVMLASLLGLYHARTRAHSSI